MTRLIPTEQELHAYIDERLEPARRAEVQAWLAANPEQAERIEAWRNDARRLRTALAGLSEMPHNPALELSRLRRRLR
ncbi:anti-sigma factor family protein, partial [Pseudomonas sp. LS_2]